MRTISRRTFLGGGLLAAAGLITLWVTRSNQEDLVVRILRRNLAYLTISDADLRRFAADFVADQDLMQTPKLRIAGLFNPLYSMVPDDTLDSIPAAQNIEDIVTTQFLLSSDFFWNSEDESQSVNYIAYYEPGRVACLNPLIPLGGAAQLKGRRAIW